MGCSKSLKGILCLLVLTASALAAEPNEAVVESPNAVDLIPADAAAAIGIRSIADLTKRGDALIDQTGAEVPMRLSDAYRFVVTILGIHRGLEEDGAAALMAFDTRIDESALVLAVPVANWEVVAGNFKLAAKDWEEGQVIDRREREGNEVFPFACFALRHQRHLYLGGKEETVRAAMKGKSLAKTIDASELKTIDKDDIIFYGNRAKMGEVWEFFTDEINYNLQRLNDDDPETLKQLASAVDDLQYALGGVWLENGFGSTVSLKFKGEKSREILTKLQASRVQATLAGLPAGRMLAAHASSGDGDSSAALIRSLLLTGLPLDERLFLSAVHRPNIAGIFGDVWQRLDGSRSALYENADSEREGQFSLLAVLETEDAERFSTDVTSLAHYVNAATLTAEEAAAAIDAKAIAELVAQLGSDEYRVRQLATTKLGLVGTPALPALQHAAAESSDLEVRFRAQDLCKQIGALQTAERDELLKDDLLRKLRPNFAHFPQQETVAGRDVDIVQIKLRDEEARYVPQLRRLFGPQWHKIRLAKLDQRIVMLVGSRIDLLEAAIQNTDGNKRGLPADPQFASFLERAPVEPTATLHLRFSRLQDAARRPTEASDGVTSLGVTITPESLRFDLFSPVAEIKAILQEFMAAQKSPR